MAALSNKDIAKAIYLASKEEEADVAELVKDVVKFLVKRKLISRSKEIFANLEKIINEEKGVVEAKVSSARALKDKSKRELSEFLKKRYRAEDVVLKENLDEGLLGGVRIQVEDEVMDLSLKNRIKKLKDHLTSTNE